MGFVINVIGFMEKLSAGYKIDHPEIVVDRGENYDILITRTYRKFF